MKSPTPKFQNRTGLSELFRERGDIAAIIIGYVRMTTAVRELLEKSGSIVRPKGRLYTVTLGDIMPPGIICTTTQVGARWCDSLRLASDPPWPDSCREFPDFWRAAEWVPCPKCGAPLVWYEAGYTPGYRVCVKKPHHHVLL